VRTDRASRFISGRLRFNIWFPRLGNRFECARQPNRQGLVCKRA
jgi:hypothetical protein